MTVRLCGGWHDGQTIPLPAELGDPPMLVMPAPTPGLDEILARDRRQIHRHLMTRVCVYARVLPGIYAYRGR